MQVTKVLSNILGMKWVRVRGCAFEEAGLVIDVVPTTRIARCGGCGCRVRRLYDRRSVRRWRHLDLGERNHGNRGSSDHGNRGTGDAERVSDHGNRGTTGRALCRMAQGAARQASQKGLESSCARSSSTAWS
jgi:hypothetical protein